MFFILIVCLTILNVGAVMNQEAPLSTSKKGTFDVSDWQNKLLELLALTKDYDVKVQKTGLKT